VFLRLSGAAASPPRVAGDEGQLRPVKEQEIDKPVDNSTRVPAPDCRKQRVAAQCMVEIVDGPHKSKVGTVVHVSKPYLWVKCPAVSKARSTPPPLSRSRGCARSSCSCMRASCRTMATSW
jgi:hypothetical protein